MTADGETDQAQDGPVFVARQLDDLIADLVAYFRESDPSESDFADESVWQYRLQAFGYSRLFLDWWSIYGPEDD